MAFEKLFENIKKIFSSKEIRNKIYFSLLILLVYRILTAVPVVGMEEGTMQSLLEGSSFSEVLAMGTSSIIAIGLGPYINASVILQLLSTVIPKLQELRESGAEGRKMISMYTRFLTVPLAVLQSFVIYATLTTATGPDGQALMAELAPLQLGTMVMTLTAGSVVMMWLSELVSESGLGGGSSLLIFYGIVAGIPYALTKDVLFKDNLEIALTIGIYIVLVVAVILVSEAEKKVKVTYSRRVASGMKYENYIPLKLTQFGVMPVIFATSLFYFPRLIADFIAQREQFGEKFVNFIGGSENVDKLQQGALWVQETIQDPWVENIGLFVLIVLFAFFYLSIVFNVEEIADNLKKSGAFIKGVRPGKDTADYLRKVSLKLTAVGSVFLALLAILPGLLQLSGIIQVTIMSGTGMLIAVGAVMEMKRQVNSMVVVRNYDRYL